MKVTNHIEDAKGHYSHLKLFRHKREKHPGPV
jgi:hypothetical protein